MRNTIISVTVAIFSLFVNKSLSLEPDYRPLDSSLRSNSIVAVTSYDDSRTAANERYRHRRQAATASPTVTELPFPTTETPLGPFPFPTPAEEIQVTDDHSYYNSTFYSDGRRFFIDLSTDVRRVVLHTALSDSHLTAGEVPLPFAFPFYGHNVSKIYIATGGFVSLSTFFHQYLSATQYIAPLMGNFDPSLNGTSRIRYAYNSTSFTVEWDDIHVQHVQDVGRFTFQTTLMSDGRILFAYQTIPSDVNDIGGGNGHKVTVGLSDGYYIDEPLYPGSYLVKRTIYHYHNVQLNKTFIRSRAAFVLTPLRTCNTLRNCSTCLAERAEIRFDCGWCEKIGRCSDGIDRHRQDWVEGGCMENAQEQCYNPVPAKTVTPPWTSPPPDHSTWPAVAAHDSAATAAIVIIIVIIVVIVLAGFGCLVYAYKNPGSRSGQQLILIQQRLRRGVRRHPQDSYQESIVGNMQVSKPTAPPAYTPPQDPPAIPTPPMAATPPVVTTMGAPGTTTVAGGNGDAIPPLPHPPQQQQQQHQASGIEINANAETAEC